MEGLWKGLRRACRSRRGGPKRGWRKGLTEGSADIALPACAVVVAQSVRAPDCGSGGCGFKSRQPPWNDGLCQTALVLGP